MEQSTNSNFKDFSIIFKEIEKFHEDNPQFSENAISEEDLQNEAAIKEFSEICREINAAGNNPVVYMTFA
jgi:hypothetical protein